MSIIKPVFGSDYIWKNLATQKLAWIDLRDGGGNCRVSDQSRPGLDPTYSEL